MFCVGARGVGWGRTGPRIGSMAKHVVSAATDPHTRASLPQPGAAPWAGRTVWARAVQGRRGCCAPHVARGARFCAAARASAVHHQRTLQPRHVPLVTLPTTLKFAGSSCPSSPCPHTVSPSLASCSAAAAGADARDDRRGRDPRVARMADAWQTLRFGAAVHCCNVPPGGECGQGTQVRARCGVWWVPRMRQRGGRGDPNGSRQAVARRWNSGAKVVSKAPSLAAIQTRYGVKWRNVRRMCGNHDVVPHVATVARKPPRLFLAAVAGCK